MPHLKRLVFFDTIGIIALFSIMELIVEDKLNNPKIACSSSAIMRENFTHLVKPSCWSKIL